MDYQSGRVKRLMLEDRREQWEKAEGVFRDQGAWKEGHGGLSVITTETV